MSMGEIEDMFERKNVIFEQRLKEFQKVKQQPMTLKLIYKYAFTTEEKMQQKQIPDQKDEKDGGESEAPSETT